MWLKGTLAVQTGPHRSGIFTVFILSYERDNLPKGMDVNVLTTRPHLKMQPADWKDQSVSGVITSL